MTPQRGPVSGPTTTRTRTSTMLVATAVMACAPAAHPPADPPADLVITGGAVWTGVPGAPLAQAVAVRGDRIAAVGSDADVGRLVGPDTRTVVANGGVVIPGFIDAHVHFIEGGFRLASVQLRDAATPQEFTARIADFARTVPPGAWITGGDWDHQNWGGELPRREWIDSITPRHPVWINRLDGHMALANSAALAAAGVTRATGEVAGGEIVRDRHGEPTGVLKDNAMALVARVEPEPSPEMRDRALDAAMRYVVEHGVTSVHHMGSWDDLATFRRAHEAGRLRTRIYAAVPLPTWEQLRDTLAARGGSRGDEWLRIGGLKGFVDGSLGSKTAAFHEPFTDAPDNTGLLVNTPEDLYRWISGADRAGLHVMVHAIGDRANRLLLDLFERVARENGGSTDRRFRVEHAQHIAPEDIPRFRALRVIPSMQPYHAIDDGRWADDVIGPERSRTTYAFRDLLDTGARLAFGSDWFVAPPTPIEGIYAAVTRRTLDGAHPGGWVPEQKISVEEALVAYTRDAAHAAFEEQIKGTIEPGKLADLVVLDRDLLRIPSPTIRDARAVLTVVGGHVVWERPSTREGRRGKDQVPNSTFGDSDLQQRRRCSAPSESSQSIGGENVGDALIAYPEVSGNGSTSVTGLTHPADHDGPNADHPPCLTAAADALQFHAGRMFYQCLLRDRSEIGPPWPRRIGIILTVMPGCGGRRRKGTRPAHIPAP